MKRKSRMLITLLTAAITFGSLFALAENKKMGYWKSKHCGDNNCRSNFPPQEKAHTEPTITPKPTN